MDLYPRSHENLPLNVIGETLIVTNLELLAAQMATLLRAELNELLPKALSRATMPPRMLKKEAAEFTGLSQRQLDTLRQRGKLRSFKVGRKVWFDTQDLLAYIDSGLLPARLKKRRS